MTQPGIGYWLGHGVKPDFKKGEIRSYSEGSLIRMTWQPPEWDFASTHQIRVLPAKTGATISIHYEKMKNGGQRKVMHSHWSEVLDRLGSLIKADS
jgi:hypothetical protein